MIGVLASPCTSEMEALITDTSSHYCIEDSYVKMIEASGGKVTPIFPCTDAASMPWIMQRISGLVFPDADGDSAYNQFAQGIWNEAMSRVSAGKHFPIAGIGYGMR